MLLLCGTFGTLNAQAESRDFDCKALSFSLCQGAGGDAWGGAEACLAPSGYKWAPENIIKHFTINSEAWDGNSDLLRNDSGLTVNPYIWTAAEIGRAEEHRAEIKKNTVPAGTTIIWSGGAHHKPGEYESDLHAKYESTTGALLEWARPSRDTIAVIRSSCLGGRE